MKKLRLALDDLEVSSFTADETDAAGGSVHGMDVVMTPRCGPASGYLTCDCTQEVGCYQTKWCTGPGCVVTAGCETAETSPC